MAVATVTMVMVSGEVIQSWRW